jgi:hypothetical protein
MTLVSLRKWEELLVNRGVTAAHLALPKVSEPTHTTTIKEQQVSFIYCCNIAAAVHQRSLWTLICCQLNTKLNKAQIVAHIEDLYEGFTASAGPQEADVRFPPDIPRNAVLQNPSAVRSGGYYI